jgi:hypothetical protein
VILGCSGPALDFAVDVKSAAKTAKAMEVILVFMGEN